MTTEEECSRMQCVDKVRTLLDECLGPPNETAFLNFDRCLENELALSVEAHPDKTISFHSFLDRISTFRPQYWGADPNAILQFAKYGWRCSDKFTIKCDVCLSTVECSSLIQKPELWSLVSHKAHEKLCFWTACPCPDRFTKITINPKILKKKMVLYIKRTVAMGSDLPSTSKDVLDSMSITSETLDMLFEILDVQQTEETVSALVLAICGWLNSEVDRTMKCGYCQRQILFHNFFSIMDKSEKQSVSDPQTCVSDDHSQSMEVCDDKSSGSERVTINSHVVDEHNVADGEKRLEDARENFKSDSRDTESSCDRAEVNSSVVNESDPVSDSACAVGELVAASANATDCKNSGGDTVVVAGKEPNEELSNVLLEAASQLNENLADKKSENSLKQSEERCDDHLELQINETPEESGRLLNGGVLEDGEVGVKSVADVRCSKKRKLQDDEDGVETENLCEDDEQNAKKLKSGSVEKNGECQEVGEISDKKVKKELVQSFNNCHSLVNERSGSCKAETSPTDQANSEQLVEKSDGSFGEIEMSENETMLQISEPYSLGNSDINTISAAEDDPIAKQDTSMKVNGDGPAFLSESIQVPKLNTFKDADVMNVSETEDMKDCSNVSENDENKELTVNSKPLECDTKLSESPDVAGNVNHVTPGSEASQASVSVENGVPMDSGVCAATLSVNSESSVMAKTDTIQRTSECEMTDTTLGRENNVEGKCDGIENASGCRLGSMDGPNAAETESCEMETEPGPVRDETSKRTGKRKLEDDSDGDNFQSKRNKPEAGVVKKQFHPVEEHRYWCIWKLRTKDRGVQKEGWRQVLDYLKLSPPTPAEQPAPDFYGEVKKVFSLLGDW